MSKNKKIKDPWTDPFGKGVPRVKTEFFQIPDIEDEIDHEDEALSSDYWKCYNLDDDGRTTTFASGATRDTSAGKLDYEGFLSPLVLHRYAEYMNKNRVQSNGRLRESDNWQRGFTRESYMKSGFRHFMDWWSLHRATVQPGQMWDVYVGQAVTDDIEEALCATLFNVMGYLHEIMLGRDEG